MILAAGAGERLGSAVPKAFSPLGGRPLAAYSLRAASRCDRIARIVLVVPAAYRSAPEDPAELLEGVTSRDVPIEGVVGGATRQASVRAGLAAVRSDAGVVVIHDAARPFATSSLFGRVVDALGVTGDGSREARSEIGALAGVVPALPCHDTVKRVRDGVILETVPREELFLAQTPQAFRVDAVRRSHELAVDRRQEATDDAMLLEAAGYRVAVIPGEPTNMKITTAEDLARAERLIASGGAAGAAPIGQYA